MVRSQSKDEEFMDTTEPSSFPVESSDGNGSPDEDVQTRSRSGSRNNNNPVLVSNGLSETASSSCERRSSRRTRKSTLPFQHSDHSTPTGIVFNGAHDVINNIETVDDKCNSKDRRKQRRGWSVWTDSDARNFFEGLAEHGKDFHAIQAYIVSKGSRQLNKGSSTTINPSTGTANIAATLTSTPVSSSAATSDLTIQSNHVTNLSSTANSHESCHQTTNQQLNTNNSHNEMKTREQVRHFYYRTWHKISSALDGIEMEDETSSSTETHPHTIINGNVLQQEVTPVPQSSKCIPTTDFKVDKAILELYGLINYGELWKKIGSKFSSKYKTHLRELVSDGVTFLRLGSKLKSKPVKIRTPVCRALKKINGFEETTNITSHVNDSTTIDTANGSLTTIVPNVLTVDLIPKDNKSFLWIQSLAQNPRVRCTVDSSQSIASFIEFLETVKWSRNRSQNSLKNMFLEDEDDENRCGLNDTKIYLKLDSSLETLLVKNQKLHVSCPSKKSVLLGEKNTDHLSPNGFNNCFNGLNNSTLTSSSLCFKSYLRNLKGKDPTTKSDSISLKSSRKERSQSTSSTTTAAFNVLSVPVSERNASPVKASPVFEDSCASSSTMGPFKETVKKLVQLNQALSAVEDAIDGPLVLNDKQEDSPLKASPNKSQDDSVSLPPPTATLVQWLTLKEQKQMMKTQTESPFKQHEKKEVDESLSLMNLSDASNSENKEHKEDDRSRVTLDAETVKKGFSSSDPLSSPTFAELLLLLSSSQTSTPKILFTYEVQHQKRSTTSSSTNVTGNDSDKTSILTQSEQQYLSMSITLKESKKESISILDKLLTAASISLTLHKKISHQINPVTSCSVTNSMLVSSTFSLPATVSSSPSVAPLMVSSTNGFTSNISVAPEDMFSTDVLPSTATDSNTRVSLSPSVSSASSSSSHTFLIPSGPAPRAAIHSTGDNTCSPVNQAQVPNVSGMTVKELMQSSNYVSNNKTSKRPRIICEDPALLTEAIKQLQANRLTPKKRQRVIRPVTVGPVQSKVLLPKPIPVRRTGPVVVTSAVVQTVHNHPVLVQSNMTPMMTQVQILAAPVQTPSLTPVVATASPLGSVCFGSQPTSVPTILIPAGVIGGHQLMGNSTIGKTGSSNSVFNVVDVGNPVIKSGEIDVSSSQLNPKDGKHDVELNDALPSFRNPSNTTIDKQETKEDVTPAPSSSFNTDSMPSLSALLELSLPDLPTAVSHSVAVASGAGDTSVMPRSTSFLNENSCSSVSDFITFASNHNHNQQSQSSTGHNNHPLSTLMTPTKDAILSLDPGPSSSLGKNNGPPHPHPWLLNEGSNSNSLGLSSLSGIFSEIG